jgi:two-component system copper resistance phosphate regulon response regulator CusR
MRLLLVEDEADLRKITVKRLSSEGHSVDACENGEDALDYAMATEYDVIILDIMLPKSDGLTVLRHLRAQGKKTPVILVTAKDSVEDRVNGLDSGADDYLVKPYSYQELSARIRTLLRRQPMNLMSNIFEVADLVMDLSAHTVTRGGNLINLSQREYALLEVLVRNKDIVLTREKIEHHIWNYDFTGGSNVIDVYIRYLRNKIDTDHEIKLIHTVRGAGYVLREGN